MVLGFPHGKENGYHIARLMSVCAGYACTRFPPIRLVDVIPGEEGNQVVIR